MARRYIRDKVGRFASKGGGSKRLGKKTSYRLEPDSKKEHYGMAAKRKKAGQKVARKLFKVKRRQTSIKTTRRQLPATISAGKIANRRKKVQLGSPLRGYKPRVAKRKAWDKPKDTLRRIGGRRWSTTYDAIHKVSSK